jgi:hypothetical protein
MVAEGKSIVVGTTTYEAARGTMGASSGDTAASEKAETAAALLAGVGVAF